MQSTYPCQQTISKGVVERAGSIRFPRRPDKYSLLQFIYSAPSVPKQLSEAARRTPATELAVIMRTNWRCTCILKVFDHLIMNPTRNRYLRFRLNCSCTSFLLCQRLAVFDSTSKQGVCQRMSAEKDQELLYKKPVACSDRRFQC